MAQPQMQMPPGVPPLQPGQQPTPQQIQAIQQQFAAEAARQGLTPQQLGEKMKAQMQQRMQQQMQAQQAQQQQGGAQPAGQQSDQQGQPRPPQQMQQQIQPGPPKPEAIALAKFLKSQELKSRPCILQEKRREMFKVKRAIRAILSPAYEKARKKNPILPEVKDRASAESAFKLLPIGMLALRVSRVEGQAPKKKTPAGQKGSVWTVKIEPQQDAADAYHYVWFYEGAQWRQRAYALAALLAVIAIVLFPLWPFWARKGVWYLSMGCLGLVGAFFGLAIVRMIIFVFTVTLGPKPGIWIYPNLFEDVGFFDSFKPWWAWRETKEGLAAKKAEKKAKKQAKRDKKAGTANGNASKSDTKVTAPATNSSTLATSAGKTLAQGAAATGVQASEGIVGRRNMSATVEEVEDD